MEITVAIPTYRRSEKVLALVRSLAPQLTGDDEVLVANDDCADCGLLPLTELPGVRVEANPSRLGMVANWNRCLEVAAGRWICVIHDDDIVAPAALQTLRNITRRYDGPAIIGNGAAGTDAKGFEAIIRGPGRDAVLNSAFCPSGTTVHRDVVAACGLFPPEFPYSPDLEYFARITARFPSIAITSPCFVRYQQHASNTQYSTWRRPDFLDQLEQIEARVAGYAGLDGRAAARRVKMRMISHMMFMRYCTRSNGDVATHRKVVRRLLREASLGPLRRAKLAVEFALPGLGRRRPGQPASPAGAS